MMQATTELDDNYASSNPENDISIYRMVQELINNVLKHAKANRLHVTSNYSGEQLRLTITHNGSGLSQEQFEKLRYNRDGLGLKNIQNRVILLRGKINFQASPDNNQINITIQLQSVSLWVK